MARLALSKDFLADFAKLDKPVRDAVNAAITKFQQDSTTKGLHLEPLTHARDRRARTIKVTQFWRGVVLAPEHGDEYCLLTVLPHDEANAFAASRRFTVNQALGVLEVRDQTALDQVEPALRTVAADREERLLGHINDADLERLGIDAQVLPIVRLLTSDAHLDAMQNLLPRPQYDALVALASGMTVEQVWSELSAQLVDTVAPVDVDPEDLVTAMERTPGEIAFVSEPEELRRILAHPFDAWRVFLHPAQRKIAYRPSFAGPAQVTGGAGTGKTVTALHRAHFLAGRLDETGPPILLTTFTRNLADSLDDQLGLLDEAGEPRERVHVLNVDRFAYQVVTQAIGHKPGVIDGTELRDEWDAMAREQGLAFGGAFLVEEWEQVVLARDITDEAAYLECSRAGRGVRLGREQRRTVWRAIAGQTARMRAAEHWSHLQIADEAAQILDESGDRPYRHVVVDESQDLHPAHWRLLRAAVPAGPDDLFIVGDPHQRIYDRRVSLATVGINIRGRSHKLTISYRTTQQILAWSVPLLGTEPATGLDDTDDVLWGSPQRQSGGGYRAPRNGHRPVIRQAQDRTAEAAALVEQVRAWLDEGVEPNAIGVAARLTRLARQATQTLADAGIPAVSLTARDRPDAVRVGTMHKMKGLEFGRVAVLGVADGMVPLPKALTPEADDPIAHAHDLQRERCLLFVACTRARDGLYVSHTGSPSPFLPAPRPA